MTISRRALSLSILLLFSPFSFASYPSPDSPFLQRRDTSDPFLRWCGKHYQQGSPPDSQLVLAGRTPVPTSSSTPLLDFRCTPAIQPYLDTESSGSFIIDANVTFDVGQAIPSNIPTASSTATNLSVTISLSSSNQKLASAQVPLGSLGTEASFSLSSLPPSTTPYEVTCSASANGHTFTTQTSVRRMPPNPYGGSITKIDRRTGALLRQTNGSSPSPAEEQGWERFLTFGFYTGTSDVMANLSIIDQMKADGFNTIHFVPDYESPEAMSTVLDHADEVGITYMADFRDIYENQTAVEPYIELFRQRKNFLMWYTNDEPDGPADPSNFTTADYSLFYDMDGYHPVSLVLNCLDFFWNNYTSGVDIVLADPYPIAVNTTFSNRYGTVCNSTYGCCGCDDCTGQLTDISDKLDLFSERRRWVGRGRELQIWNVPQAFNGTDEFWERVPTGDEFKLQTVLSVNHGAVGLMPWDNPYDTPDIAQAAREIAPIFSQQLAPVLLDPSATRVALNAHANDSQTDVAAWVRSSTGNSSSSLEALILFANTEYSAKVTAIDLAGAGLQPASSGSPNVLFGTARIQAGSILASLESVGIVGVTVPLQAFSPPNQTAHGPLGTQSTGKSAAVGIDTRWTWLSGLIVLALLSILGL